MKKIFSLMAFAGMFALMSFGMGVKTDCFDGAQQAADSTLINGGTQEQADERFADYFEVCSEKEPIEISNN